MSTPIVSVHSDISTPSNNFKYTTNSPQKWSYLSSNFDISQTKNPNLHFTTTEITPLTGREYFSHNVSEASILGGRSENEDTHSYFKGSFTHFPTGTFELFCVFDGHSGNQVSKWMAQNAPHIISEKLKKINSTEEIIETLEQSQEEWQEQMPLYLRGGCTTTILITLRLTNIWYAYVLQIGDGEVIMFNSEGDLLPQSTQLIYDTASQKTRHLDNLPYITIPHILTGPIEHINGPEYNQSTYTSLDEVNFDDYKSTVSIEEYNEWKTVICCKKLNPEQILLYPVRDGTSTSWRFKNKVQPTRATSTSFSRGEKVCSSGVIYKWVLGSDTSEAQISNLKFIVACDGMRDLKIADEKLMGRLISNPTKEFQNYFEDHIFLKFRAKNFAKWEKTHPRPPKSSLLSEKIAWILEAGKSGGPISKDLDYPWRRSIQEAHDIFKLYETNQKTMTTAEILVQYAAARGSSDNITAYVIE